MAKRFSESTKWNDDWFMGLGGEFKLFWLYLLDNVDHAGLWSPNFRLASFQIGFELTPQKVLEVFEGRILVVKENVWFIPKFIEFQYGTLNRENRVHESVIQRLSKYQIIPETLLILEAPNKALTSPLQGAKDKEKDKAKVKSKDNSRGVQGGFLKFDLEAAYQAYPRKLGKSDGIKRLTREIRTESEYQSLKTAILHYKTHCENEKLEPKFIKHFGTFVSSWRDWLDPQHGTSENFVTSGLIQTEEEMNAYMLKRGLSA